MVISWIIIIVLGAHRQLKSKLVLTVLPDLKSPKVYSISMFKLSSVPLLHAKVKNNIFRVGCIDL